VRRLIAILVVVGALVGASFTVSALAAQGPATVHAKKHAAKRHSTKRHHSTRAAQATNQNTGDTTGDNSNETAGETSGESSAESEAGQPGEPANGHQDTGADAQHECTGNCVE
jgi:hypothetical protein